MGGPNSPEKTPKGIPFNVGIWDGPGGKSVLAAFNPLTYSGNIYYDLSKSSPEFSKYHSITSTGPSAWNWMAKPPAFPWTITTTARATLAEPPRKPR